MQIRPRTLTTPWSCAETDVLQGKATREVKVEQAATPERKEMRNKRLQEIQDQASEPPHVHTCKISTTCTMSTRHHNTERPRHGSQSHVHCVVVSPRRARGDRSRDLSHVNPQVDEIKAKKSVEQKLEEVAALPEEQEQEHKQEQTPAPAPEEKKASRCSIM